MGSERCRGAVLGALRSEPGGAVVEELLALWGRDAVIATLQDIVSDYDADAGAGGGPSVVLAALRLEKEILCSQREEAAAAAAVAGAVGREGLQAIRQEIAQARMKLEAEAGAEAEADFDMGIQDKAGRSVGVPGGGPDDGLGGSQDDGQFGGWRLCGAEWRPKPMGVF